MTGRKKQSLAVRLIDFFLEKELNQVLNAVFIILGFLGFMAIVATFSVATWLAVKDGAEGFGTGAFGDSFGFTTSLFTGAAFFGLAVSTILQRRELKAAQDSFKELQTQTKQVLSTQRTQILEDRFFKLIEQIDSRRRDTPKPFLLADQVAEDLIEIADGLVLDGLTNDELIEEFQKQLVFHRTKNAKKLQC